MRIVFFLPDADAGVAQIVKTILKYKPQSNDEYVVVLFSLIGDESNHPIADFEGPGTIIRFSYSKLENLFTVYKRLAEQTLVSDKDVIVANDGWELRMAVALKLKNPIVYILHGDFRYYYQVCKLNQDIIDLFIAYSNKIFEELANSKLSKENRHRVQKIYYPSSVVQLEPMASPRMAGVFKILFAGTLDERKGAHLLKGIYDEVSLSIDNFQFQIIGDGDLKQELDYQFSGCHNVMLEGWKPNEYVIRKMKEADVFLFPSSSEGLPNVLIEALHSGAVPIASRLESGVLDIVEDGVNGSLVETGNVKGYAAAIVSLYKNNDLKNRLRQNGKMGLEKFEPFRQAALYHEAIKQVAAQSRIKVSPQYSMGRWLNSPWLPNLFVKAIRSVIRHPKL